MSVREKDTIIIFDREKKKRMFVSRLLKLGIMKMMRMDREIMRIEIDEHGGIS